MTVKSFIVQAPGWIYVEMKITLTYNVEVKINAVKIFVVMGFRLGIYKLFY